MGIYLRSTSPPPLGYPWDVPSFINRSYHTRYVRESNEEKYIILDIRLEKWLFIPHTGADILDRSWLFGNEYHYLIVINHTLSPMNIVNLISYVCMAQQMKYFIRNPLRTLRNTLPQYPKMYDTDNFFDYLKVGVWYCASCHIIFQL